MTSTRQYLVVGFEHGYRIEDGQNGAYSIRLDDLFDLDKEPTEVDITLADQIELILNLSVGQSAHVSLCRDHEASKGVILRTM